MYPSMQWTRVFVSQHAMGQEVSSSGFRGCTPLGTPPGHTPLDTPLDTVEMTIEVGGTHPTGMFLVSLINLLAVPVVIFTST